MGLPSWHTLLLAAGGSGLGIGLTWHLVQGQRDRLANDADFIKRAVSLTKEQAAIKELVGNEIVFGKIRVVDGWSKLQPLHVQLRMPVKGERDSGFLYAYARRKDEKKLLKLYKLEATFAKISGKKLVIMDETDKVDQADDDDDDVDVDALAKLTKKIDERDKEPAKEKNRKKTVEEMKAEMKNWDWR